MKNNGSHFKTNINCGGCIASVKPHLDKTVGAGQWQVDIADKNKILTVSSETVSEAQVIETVKKAGFKIEALSQ